MQFIDKLETDQLPKTVKPSKARLVALVLLFFLTAAVAAALFFISQNYSLRNELVETTKRLSATEFSFNLAQDIIDKDPKVIDEVKEHKIGSWVVVEKREGKNVIIWLERPGSPEVSQVSRLLEISNSFTTSVSFVTSTDPDIYVVKTNESLGEVSVSNYYYFDSNTHQLAEVTHSVNGLGIDGVLLGRQFQMIPITTSTNNEDQTLVMGIEVNGQSKYVLPKPVLDTDEPCDGICPEANMMGYVGVSGDLKNIYFYMFDKKYVFDAEENTVQPLSSFPKFVEFEMY